MDGRLLNLTEESPKPGEKWIEVDRAEVEKTYGGIVNLYLRVIDGKLIRLEPDDPALTVQLTPGNTWNADNEYRLITGEPGVDTSGWSSKTD